METTHTTYIRNFRWDDFWEDSTWYTRLTVSFMFAVLTGLGAMARFYTPWTPVPFTLQIVPVMLSGFLLGPYYGLLAMLLYIAMGCVGVPFFAFSTGPFTLLGATGGYIMGFAVASFIIGGLRNRYNSTAWTYGVMALGLGVIYIMGSVQLAVVLSLSPFQAFEYGIAPFLFWDALKVLLSGSVAGLITRNSKYHGSHSTV